MGLDLTTLSRRGFLTAACCAAAAPLTTKLSFAEMPGDNRFVTIVLRGAMDGLDLVQPHGDAGFKLLRPKLALGEADGLIDLDGFFGLHPAAAPLMPLWQARELGFVHAVSTPYRNVRSHFDGQDLLESGAQAVGDKIEGGWLNRMLSFSKAKVSAIDVNSTPEIILSGANKADIWASDSDVGLAEDELAFVKRLYANDPVFSRDLEEALGLDMLTQEMRDTVKGGGIAAVARTAASLLSDRYRIASFTINGWDTHVGQKQGFKGAATNLTQAILTLKTGLGAEAWRKTAVLAITEFGRTARQNGSDGTDHGTGGCAVLAGGAIAGGRVYGRWPGLGEGQLLDDRDLMPTGDVRAVAATLLMQQFGIGARELTSAVFPGLEFDGRSVLL